MPQASSMTDHRRIVDELLLDVANQDIRFHRSGANELTLDDVLKMAADINIQLNLLKTTNLALKEINANTMGVRDAADTAWKNLEIGLLLFKNDLTAQENGLSLRAKNTDGYYLIGEARQNTVGMAEIYRMVGAAEPRFGHTLPLNLRGSTELTISGGAITVGVASGKAWYTVDTEGDAASDDLDTINGGTAGDIIVLKAQNTGRTVNITDGVGNIYIRAGAAIALDDTEKAVALFCDGANWFDL